VSTLVCAVRNVSCTVTYCATTLANQEVRGRKSPSGVHGQSPGRRSGERSPPEAEAFCTFAHNILFRALIVLFSYGYNIIIQATFLTLHFLPYMRDFFADQRGHGPSGPMVNVNPDVDPDRGTSCRNFNIAILAIVEIREFSDIPKI